MDITTPARLLKLLARSPQTKVRELDLRLRQSQSYLHNLDLQPTQAQYAAAADYLTGYTGLIWSVPDTMAVLDLYPFERIRLAEHGLSWPHGAAKVLPDVAAHFILRCRWPISRDKVDMNRFFEVLRAQGEKLGFPRLPQSPEAMSPEERRACFTLIAGGPA